MNRLNVKNVVAGMSNKEKIEGIECIVSNVVNNSEVFVKFTTDKNIMICHENKRVLTKALDRLVKKGFHSAVDLSDDIEATYKIKFPVK